MSSLNFKLALLGQIYGGEGLLYTYPENKIQLAQSGAYPDWINALPYDTRFLRELVDSEGDCFSVRYGKEGLFYAYTKYNQHDARNGVAMVVLYTEGKACNDAKQLITVLRNLMDYFLEKTTSKDIQDDDVVELTKNLSFPYSIPKQNSEKLNKSACRVYRTDEELYNYFNWAIQDIYTRYRWVHFIPDKYKKATINLDAYEEIRTPLVKCYPIKNLDGGLLQLQLKDTRYSIEYTKDNFLPQEVSFFVGQPSKYIKFDNDVIIVKSIDELGLVFEKKVIIQLYDKINNKLIKEDNYYISQGKEKSIRCSLPGYESQMITLKSTDFSVAENIKKVYLSPEKRISPHEDGFVGKDDTNVVRLKKKNLWMGILILFCIGCAIGCIIDFSVQRFFLENPALSQIDSLETKVCSLNNQKLELDQKIKTQKEEIDKLREDIKNKETEIENLKKELNKKSQTASTKSIAKSPSSGSKARDYLNENNEWCLYGLSSSKNTDEYRFLELLVKAEDLENLIAHDLYYTIRNEKWQDIIELISTVRGKNIADRKILGAIKSANTNWDSSKKSLMPGKTLQDGTINLDNLKNIISNLK